MSPSEYSEIYSKYSHYIWLWAVCSYLDPHNGTVTYSIWTFPAGEAPRDTEVCEHW